MTGALHSYGRFGALAALALAALPWCSFIARGGETPPDPSPAPGSPAAPLAAPPADSFRAYDRPSDNGNILGVEWGRSPSEGKGVYYIVEIASEQDYKEGRFKQRRIPSESSFKSDYPEFYGTSAKNRQIHYLNIEPAKFYPPMLARVEQPSEEELGKLSATARARLVAKVAYEEKQARKRLMADRLEINSQRYYLRLAISNGAQTVFVEEGGRPKVVAAASRANYFKMFKLNNLVFAVAFCAIVLAFIRAARKNPNLFIRKIAGLEAVDEAIGRSTEMGRRVFFVHGLDDMGSLSTIAAVNILARVCRRAAEYETRVRVMNNDPIVMAVSQEVAKQAYTEAGHPEAYNPDDVSLVAADQFSYVAAVDGLMVRERPAAIFLMGYFYAESLLLSEMGAATGAIQIAGTDSYTQLPFFITTCDYTLMGEELYAASAYLSREPRLLGSLRGQDVGKAFLMIAFIVGTLLSTLGLDWIRSLFRAY